jgi:hypothetical protein
MLIKTRGQYQVQVQKRTRVVAEDPAEGIGEKNVLKNEKISIRAKKNV